MTGLPTWQVSHHDRCPFIALNIGKIGHSSVKMFSDQRVSSYKGGRIFFYVSHLHGPIKQGRSVEIK